MCPPSENIQKRRTDKSSARRPTFEGQRETSRRYTVNTGSDDDVEPALLQEPVTPHPESLFFFPLAIRLFRSPHTVKSVIIHICATRKLCVCMCVYTTRSTVFTHEFIEGAVPDEGHEREDRLVGGLETTGRRLIVGDMGGER